jgi:hypothetical protein
LLNLLMRFYDPTWGEIRLDGVPLRQLALSDLRRQIGVVPQDAVVFRESLADTSPGRCPGAGGHAAAVGATCSRFRCCRLLNLR